MNIPDDKKENFDNNTNFYVLCFLLGGLLMYEWEELEVISSSKLIM